MGVSTRLHDRDLRHALLTHLLSQDLSDTRIVEEMGLLHGDRRIDVAVINGEIHGYEIKSAADDLTRLPMQASVYSAVLDRATLVVSPSHLADSAALVPRWWAIIVAGATDDAIDLVEVRPGSANPARDPLSIAQLLWREEAVALLATHGLAASVARLPRRLLFERLATNVPIDVLAAGVRDALKQRAQWRPAVGPR